MTTAVVALHCLPLPVAAAVGGVYAWLLMAAAIFSLAFELNKQRLAGAAKRLDSTGVNDWLLYSEVGDPRKIQLIDAMDFGRFMLLLVAQDGRKFRLVVSARQQADGQLHRLRVWLAYRSEYG